MEDYRYTGAPLVTVEQARRALGDIIPQSTFYRLAHKQIIPSTKIGGRIYIHSDWLDKKLLGFR